MLTKKRRCLSLQLSLPNGARVTFGTTTNTLVVADAATLHGGVTGAGGVTVAAGGLTVVEGGATILSRQVSSCCVRQTFLAGLRSVHVFVYSVVVVCVISSQLQPVK